MSATQDVILGRPKAEWTPTRDAYLVELFIDQHNFGRTAYNEFKNEMIRSVTRDFNKKFGMNLEESQVKNRYNVMKKDYGVVKTLLTRAGFGWDESRQMVVADDKVWDSYIAVKCEARPFRRKSFPLYKQMSIIFEGERVAGKFQLPNGAPFRVHDRQLKKRKSIGPSASGRKKRACENIGETLENALSEMFSAFTFKAMQRNASNEKAVYQKCLEQLQKLDEFDDTEFVKAVNVLRDDKNAIAFMAIKGPRRLMWLRSLWQ
ncbi:hypothetical protein OIU84_014962 [Salix udensis]|uniref:Myb/SANT-like domain-containing protein n=1 Tax=Salix udensis TaxID=889485 RepID=A0AAD6NRZ3_9ROSI|nr:hypothetical protein OIU84_014962 [Salix udensis]